MKNEIPLILSFLNFLSFMWSVIKIFRQHPSMESTSYLALRMNSVAVWVASLYAISYSDLSVSAGMILSVIQLMTLILFWYHTRIAKKFNLTLAFSTDEPTKLIQEGLYKYIRHPFYTIYMTSYFSVAVVTQDLVVSVLSLSMFAIYYYATVFEEKKFETGSLAEVYREYKNRAGRFFPKIPR